MSPQRCHRESKLCGISEWSSVELLPLQRDAEDICAGRDGLAAGIYNKRKETLVIRRSAKHKNIIATKYTSG